MFFGFAGIRQNRKKRRYHPTDIFVWTSLDAVETESAVHVPRFIWWIEFELTSLLYRTTLGAVSGPTISTKSLFLDSNFGRRKERLNKLKLPDGTNMFAKGRMAEPTVDGECQHEIVDQKPRCPPWTIHISSTS